MSNLNDFGEEVVPMRGTAVAPFARALQSTRRWAEDCRVTQIHETTSTGENFLRYDIRLQGESAHKHKH